MYVAHCRVYSRTRRANAEIKTRCVVADAMMFLSRKPKVSVFHTHIFDEINRFIYQSFYRECTRLNKTFDYVDVLLTD